MVLHIWEAHILRALPHYRWLPLGGACININQDLEPLGEPGDRSRALHIMSKRGFVPW